MKKTSVRDIIDRARAMGHDALGIVNDPEIVETLAKLAKRREEKQMRKLAAILDGLVNKYREFSFKLGKKDGMFVTEMNVPPYKPATGASRDLMYALMTTLAQLRLNIDPHRVIMALDERELDDAVTELENAVPPLPPSTFTFQD